MATLPRRLDLVNHMLGQRAAVTIVLALAVSGCTAGDGTEHTGEALGSPCSVDVSGSLPGVRITIASESCTYERGAPATFTFRVTTSDEVPTIDVPAINGCTGVLHPLPTSTRIDSWLTWSIDGTSLAGDKQQFCQCDTGCGGGLAASTQTPPVGVYEQEIEWSGRTWQGPSDFGQAMGEYFDVGSYDVRVTFHGFTNGSVEAALPIVIVP